MRKIITLIVVVGAAVFLYNRIDLFKYKEKSLVKEAQSRVNAILDGIKLNKDGIPKDEQLAICQWWKNSIIILDKDEFERACDAFDAWRKELGIFPYIQSHTIIDAVYEKDSNPPAVTVNVKIDNRNYALRVTKGEPIALGSRKNQGKIIMTVPINEPL